MPSTQSNGLPVIVGITGASGAMLAGATIDLLLEMEHAVIATALAGREDGMASGDG